MVQTEGVPAENTKDSSNWCHLTETVNMLCLAVCQIEATMTDSNVSVETLTTAFSQLAANNTKVSDQVQNLKSIDELDAFKEKIVSTAEQINTNINKSVLAFQFYDRVCQRLDHVARSLEHVSELLAEGKIDDPESWCKLQTTIKSDYTMEAERIMFEFVMRGGSVSEALKIYRHHFDQEQTKDEHGDDVELF